MTLPNFIIFGGPKCGSTSLCNYLAQPFAEAIIADQKGEYYKSYINDGFYGKHLAKYFELFPASQIKIFLFEDFVNDTVKVVQEIYRFLEVDENFLPDVSTKDAVSGVPYNRQFYNFIYKPNAIKKVIKSIIKPILPTLNRRKLWSKAVEKSLKKPQMNLEDRQKVLEIYKDDILILQDLIGRDLSSWLKIN